MNNVSKRSAEVNNVKCFDTHKENLVTLDSDFFFFFFLIFEISAILCIGLSDKELIFIFYTGTPGRTRCVRQQEA